jgi:hypothetical protein
MELICEEPQTQGLLGPNSIKTGDNQKSGWNQYTGKNKRTKAMNKKHPTVFLT